MKQRVRVSGNTALLTLLTETKGGPGANLVLRGSMECLELAEQLIEAAERLMDHESQPLKSKQKKPHLRVLS